MHENILENQSTFGGRKILFSNKNGSNNFDPFVSEIANWALHNTGLIISL